ncbi:MAG: hypothetical protein AB7S75_20615 [Desulfococcaceae bacterium]
MSAGIRLSNSDLFIKAIKAGSQRAKERMKIFRQWLTLHKYQSRRRMGNTVLNHDGGLSEP